MTEIDLVGLLLQTSTCPIAPPSPLFAALLGAVGAGAALVVPRVVVALAQAGRRVWWQRRTRARIARLCRPRSA
jgi:hypothetical protein